MTSFGKWQGYEASPYEHVNAIVDSPTLEPVNVLVPPGPVGLREKTAPLKVTVFP